MTAHVHADEMKLYAQDAAETEAPWSRWQFKNKGGSVWLDIYENPRWSNIAEYRRKPETIRIGDMDVPKPMTFAPAKGSSYFVPDADSSIMYCTYTWEGHRFDLILLDRAMAHSTKEAAIQHAMAMVLASGGKID
jgi:hypothetical protein